MQIAYRACRALHACSCFARIFYNADFETHFAELVAAVRDVSVWARPAMCSLVTFAPQSAHVPVLSRRRRPLLLHHDRRTYL